jgi:hypothetical protein
MCSDDSKYVLQIVQAVRAMLDLQAEKYAASDSDYDDAITATYTKMQEAHNKLFSDWQLSRVARRKRDLEETLEHFLLEVTKRQATAENRSSWWECAEEYLLGVRPSGSGDVPLPASN